MSQCVRRRLPGALGALIVFLFLLVARTATAGIPCDCICERGKTDNGIRAVMSNKPGCDIYAAVKKYPQKDPATSLQYPLQIQLRSIFAANLERKADGSYERHGVLRGCTRDGKPSPDADSDEKKVCQHLAFYYALDGVEITIPSERAYTPAEQAAIDAAKAAAQNRLDEAAAQKRDEDRRELAAEKRVRELEKELEAQKAETKSRDDVIAANREIAWRAKFFTTAIAVISLVGAWAFLMTLWASASRIKLRPITADGYRYSDPLEAVRDLAMKLSGVRAKMQTESAKQSEELAGARSRVAELEELVAKHADSVSTSARLVESFRKERDSFKESLEALRKERGQGVEGFKEEIQRLQKQNEELLYHWNLADEARLELENWRVKQKSLLHEKTAEIIRLGHKLQNADSRLTELETQNELLRYARGTNSANETEQAPPADTLASAIDEPEEAVTQVRGPEALKPPMKRRHTAPYPLRDIFPSSASSRPASSGSSLPPGIETELVCYRQAFELINNYLFWNYGDRPCDEKLEDRIKRTVDAVSDVCSCVSTARTQTSRPPALSPGTIPPLSNSDIFRVAALMGVKDDFDLPGFQRGILGASNANMAECLKTCIHEWARRGERSGDLVYAIDMPFEIYDLHAFLDSQLLCGAEISPLVPDGCADELYLVKHAGAAAFNRRSRIPSFPPSAMPQTSG